MPATITAMKLKGMLSQIVIGLLFILPVIFFSIVYFLQVTSSEDIYQGAGQPISIISDALSAFQWSARFGDMYAWSVINFFDYRYELGVDTIFRLIDVIVAVGIFLLVTAMVLGRKPRWEIRDASLFAVSFLVVFLSDYSRPLLSSFSQIHNYLSIALFSLIFLLPFVFQLRGKEFPSRPVNKLLMFTVGFLFAFASNVTPVTFLITAVLVILYDKLVLKRTLNLSLVLRSWQIFAFAGMLIALIVMYILGPGLSSYTQNYNNSYVSIESLISSPLTNGLALIGNMANNFQSLAPAFLMLLLIVLVEYVIYRKNLIPKQREQVAGIRFSVIALVFFVVHILAVSQINVTGVERILLPAYLCVVVGILFTVNRLLQIGDVKPKILMLLAVPVIFLLSAVTVDMSVVMAQHQREAAVVLDRIKQADDMEVCVTQADNPTAKSPLLKYYQRELFVDWAMPLTIYGKQVNWCNSST